MGFPPGGSRVGVHARRHDQPLLEQIGRFPFWQLLDVGCGTGELLRMVGERFPETTRTGLDLSAEMLSVARHKLGEGVELVQGEGGVLPLDAEYVQKVAKLCAERDWLLLIDEVQTGIGRTGTLFAFQQYGILPDAVSFAKGIAGGLPMGGFLANERCRDVLGPGTHASTFGGNPICAAAAQVVLDTLDEDALAQVKEKGHYIRTRIEHMGLSSLGETRGLGMMIGVEVKGEENNKVLAARLIRNGLLVLTAGSALRLLPPLTISMAEIDKGLAIMKETLL